MKTQCHTLEIIVFKKIEPQVVLLDNAHSCAVNAGAQARYNERVQRAMEGTVWMAGGCASWYIDKQGRNTTLWPGFTFRFRELTKTFDREHYELRPAPVREREEVYA